MKHLRALIYVTGSLAALLLVLCGDESNPSGPGSGSCEKLATELQKETENFSTASLDYAFTPSETNCRKMAEAGKKYVNALKSYANCHGITADQKSQLQLAIDDAQNTLDNLSCEGEDGPVTAECGELAAKINEEASKYADAEEAYYSNQTDANCRKLAQAISALLAVSESYVDCPHLSAQVKSEYRQDIEDMRDYLNSLSCESEP